MHKHSAALTHAGFVISNRLMQPSTLRRGLGAEVTSLRRKKALYSFCQTVSDWLGVKVVAGRVMLIEQRQGGGWQKVEDE